jgi:hypothetical protein
MWLAGLLLTPLANEVVELWQVEQSAVVTWWPAPCGLGTTPVKLLPVAPARWQVAQPLVMPVCTIAVLGPKALVDLWQVSHGWVLGMWPAPWGTGVTP